MKAVLNKFKQNFIKNISLYLAVLAMVVGVVLAINFNSKLPRTIAPASALIALQDMQENLEGQNEVYKKQLSDTENRINELQTQAKGREKSLEGLVASVENLKARADLTDIESEGIVVILNDTGERVSNPNSIAHASDMRDLVNHFFANGATAISIEGAGKEERVSFFSSIDCIVNTVLINGTKIVPPFKIRVAGNQERLTQAVNDRVALKMIYDRVDSEGLEFHLEDTTGAITITKYSGPVEIKNAKLK